MGAQSEIELILHRNGLILRRNGFPVIINDDFLEEGWGRGVTACEGGYGSFKIYFKRYNCMRFLHDYFC